MSTRANSCFIPWRIRRSGILELVVVTAKLNSNSWQLCSCIIGMPTCAVSDHPLVWLWARSIIDLGFWGLKCFFIRSAHSRLAARSLAISWQTSNSASVLVQVEVHILEQCICTCASTSAYTQIVHLYLRKYKYSNSASVLAKYKCIYSNSASVLAQVQILKQCICTCASTSSYTRTVHLYLHKYKCIYILKFACTIVYICTSRMYWENDLYGRSNIITCMSNVKSLINLSNKIWPSNSPS